MKESGFNEFWAAWPKNKNGGYQRKGGKQQCLQRWIKGHYWTQAQTIMAHVEWLKTTQDWIKDNGAFIPMPITYLNQQRWDGADIPESKKTVSAAELVTIPYVRQESYFVRKFKER